MHSDLSRTIPHKPVLFIDFDQTMTNGDDLIKPLVHSIYEIAYERGANKRLLDFIGQKARSEGKYGIYNFILAFCQNNMTKFNEFCDELFKRIDYSSIHRDDKLFEVMKKCSKKYDLYILTNNHRKHVDIGLRQLFGVGIDEIDFIKSFDILETYHDERFWGKQMEGSLEQACKRVGATPDECTMIDDMRENLNMAKKIGMKTILVKKNNLSNILEKLLQ